MLMVKTMALTRRAVILVFLIGEYLAVPFFLIHEPQDVTVKEGGNITLDCVFSLSAPKCYWAMDDEPIEFGGRYELIGDTSMGNCTLKINRVVPHFDEGVWTCSYPKESNSHFSLRSRGSLVKVQDPVDEVIEKSEVGSGEEPSAVLLENVSADELNILKEEYLVAEKKRPKYQIAKSVNRITEIENNMKESGSGDLQGLEKDMIL